MKFSVASLVICITSVDGFSIPTSFYSTRPSTQLNAASSLNESFDAYLPLLDRLNQNLAAASTSISTTPAAASTATAAPIVVDSSQQTLLDVLSSTLDAANQAAAASAEVSKLALQYRPSIDANADMASALLSTDVSSKLSAFESELQALRTASADEMDLAPLLAALHDAIDASLHAAEFASRSSAEAVDAMVLFNVQLGHDMSHHLASIPIEGAHLSGIVEGMMQSFTNGVAWSEAAAWQPLAHVIDRKLDDFSWDGGARLSEGAAAILVVYGIVAYLMGYLTQIGEWEGYKNDIRSRMEDGTLDVKQLAREVGYIQSNLATTASTLTSVDYDAAARLAYQSSRETVSFDSFKARYLLETSTMMAKKNPYAKPILSPKPSLVSTAVKKYTLKSVDYDAATRLAYQTSNPSTNFETFQSQYLAQTSAMVAQKHKNRQADDTALPTPPVQEISAESFLKQPMVNVLTKAKPSETTVESTSKMPPASPLARLLVEELGLELSSIGKGSGKNGKILIEDVRRFQDNMEGARRLMVKNAPYFATANA